MTTKQLDDYGAKILFDFGAKSAPYLTYWTLVGNKGGFMAQHEHTIIVTEGKPIILTEMNGVWN